MEKRYYTSINWAPWLGVGFVLSSVFLSIISNVWLSALLVFLSFLPALVVTLTLRGYYLIENNQIKYCYDRKTKRETDFAISLVDVTRIQRVDKSVAISFDNGDEITKRVHDAETFVQDIKQHNPRIEL